MQYEMSLLESPFEKIKNGTKTVEVRLLDEKRRKLRIGDVIIFSKLPQKSEKISAKISELSQFKTFNDLFLHFSPLSVGSLPDPKPSEQLKAIRKIYSEEEELKYGVLAIRLTLL